MADGNKVRKVLVVLDGDQAKQLAELEKRDGSNGNVVMRKALAALYSQRETLIPLNVA